MEGKETWANFIDLPRCEFPLAFDEWARPEECEEPATRMADWGEGGKMYLCSKHADEIYEAETIEVYDADTIEVERVGKGE